MRKSLLFLGLVVVLATLLKAIAVDPKICPAKAESKAIAY